VIPSYHRILRFPFASDHPQARPSPELAATLDERLEAGGTLAALATAPAPRRHAAMSLDDSGAADEIAALDFARRAQVTEAGAGTPGAARAGRGRAGDRYPGTPPPGELLGRVRAYLGYVGTLLDARTTLAGHRRLLVVGGWLSLLAATTLIDLHRDHAAAAHLRTAAQLARETRAALGRVEALVSPLPVRDRPEHHYRYDPAKSEAYTATTLAWLGDPAAESYARHILARLESATDGPPRPRRAASARLDLSLALIASGRHDEAAGTALEAIDSGRSVPSNYWRAREVIHAVADRRVPEAADLAEAYREACRDGEQPALP